MGWSPLWESIAGRGHVRTWAGIKVEEGELEKCKGYIGVHIKRKEGLEKRGYGGLVVEYGWVLEGGRDQELFTRHVFRGLLSLLFNGVEAFTCKNAHHNNI